MSFNSFQFKTMLMSLWSDEGIQTAFQRCIFYPLFYIWGILLAKQTFTFYWLCLCNGFVFALIFPGEMNTSWLTQCSISWTMWRESLRQTMFQHCRFISLKLYLFVSFRRLTLISITCFLSFMLKASFPGYSLLSENNKGGDRVQDGNWQVGQRFKIFSKLIQRFLRVKLFH